MLPLYFIKMFHSVGYLDGGGEESVKIERFYSIYDNILRQGPVALLWLSVAIVIVSLTLSIARIFVKGNKVLKIVDYVIFGIAIIFFFIMLFLAATVDYKY